MNFSGDTRVLPPLDGSVTLPESIDFHTKYNPYKPMFTFHEDGSSTIAEITFVEFGRACDRVAHRLRPQRSGSEGEIVAVVALSDTLLYHAVSIGMMRGGLIPYLMSPRNTAAAIIKMIKETSCHRLLTTQETLRPLISEIRTELAQSQPVYELIIEEMPPLHEIYPKLGVERLTDPFEEYPKRAVRPPLDDIMLYLHSSGSTGFPKSIPETYRAFVHWASFPPIVDIGDHKPHISMACMSLPPFHTLGVISQLLHNTYALTPVPLYPPIAVSPSALPVMPTPDNILEHVRRNKANSLVTIPTLLQIWAQDQRYVDFLATLEFITYSGGSVPTKLGDFMASKGVNLCPIYGGTEFGAPTHPMRKPGGKQDWEWLAFDDRTNLNWEAQGDGKYELQILACKEHQLSVENMSGVKGYATSDLFIPHPTVPGFWKIVGRKDDVIIHSTGEKTVPAPMENIVMNSPHVMGAIIFGREHDQAGILIELKPTHAINPRDEAELVKGRNLIWPFIEEANKVAPTYSRLFKELVLISSPDKPLPRAGKGTIMRKAALSLYNEEIEAIYATVESTTGIENVVPPASWTTENTEHWLKEQIEDIHSGREFSISGDVFEQGMDSLSATILRRRITGALRSKETQKAAQLVAQNTIYTYPSIAKLSKFLVQIVKDPSAFVETTNRTEEIEHMISTYSAGLNEPLLRAGLNNGSSPNVAVVLITGSTGNLGSQVLETILRDPLVKRIYSFNRPSKGSQTIAQRHIERFLDKGFDIELLSSNKLVFVEGDMSKGDLGLVKETYDELLNTVTVIIHNAWRLDFNLSLSSFEPNIRGTRNLIDLARSSSHASSLKFLFTSSVASAYSWDQSRGPYPEEVVTDPRFAVGNGYGESKYVSERILSQSGVQTTSFRIGQICGGIPNGAWAITDWVPILVQSSIHLNALPSAIGVNDFLGLQAYSSWLPMHSVSQAILDVALSDSKSADALNLVHPRPVSWEVLMSDINDALVQEGVSASRIPVVSFKEWFSLLEARSINATDDVIKQIPAIKILDFFRSFADTDATLRLVNKHDAESGGLANFSTVKAQTISKTMKDLPAIGARDAHLWVRYWKSAGLFTGK
ncbi:hypothetical protein B0H34DRAFT_661311 [Crassisporium funariophilum]|nr:hypothetical protein B0H34DRAFT_661311 [Crassisporium funariophilum]